MITIATCFSHFGAMRYKKCCDERGFTARLMPVPRNLSSSCGTCVRVESENYLIPEGLLTQEVEQIVQVDEHGLRYYTLWKA